MLRGLILTTLCFMLLAAALPAQSEVSVRLDRSGQYVTTQVVAGGYGAVERKIWSPRGRSLKKSEALNPSGDANGDLFPTVAEPLSAPHHPVVVWSRFDGVEYDLAWARWTDLGWDPIQWVSQPDRLGDDLDPDAVFDGGGRPYVIWWRDEADGGRVYVSTLLDRGWSPAHLISDPTVDSRYPVLRHDSGAGLVFQYETPTGTATGVVAFKLPDTITDDINPQIVVKMVQHYDHQRKR